MSILPSAPVIPESDNVVPGSAMNMALATWVRVGAGSPEQLATLSLVLSAADIDHLVDHDSGAVQVAPADNARALAEWSAYEEENRGWPPPPPPSARGCSGRNTPCPRTRASCAPPPRAG